MQQSGETSDRPGVRFPFLKKQKRNPVSAIPKYVNLCLALSPPHSRILIVHCCVPSHRNGSATWLKKVEVVKHQERVITGDENDPNESNTVDARQPLNGVKQRQVAQPALPSSASSFSIPSQPTSFSTAARAHSLPTIPAQRSVPKTAVPQRVQQPPANLALTQSSSGPSSSFPVPSSRSQSVGLPLPRHSSFARKPTHQQNTNTRVQQTQQPKQSADLSQAAWLAQQEQRQQQQQQQQRQHRQSFKMEDQASHDEHDCEQQYTEPSVFVGARNTPTPPSSLFSLNPDSQHHPDPERCVKLRSLDHI